jgi:chromosome partitioning protein
MILKSKLERKTKNYRYVILDAPPNVGIISRNGLQLSDYYVVPVIPDYLSTYGIDQLISELGGTYHINVPPLGIIISKFKSNATTHKTFIELLRSKEVMNKGPHVFNQTVRDTVRAEDFPSRHDSYKGMTLGQLFGYGDSNLRSDIMSLTKEIVDEVEKYGE